MLDTYDDGRPKRVKMKIKAAGLTDEQEVEYSWTDTTAGWTHSSRPVEVPRSALHVDAAG